MKKTLQIDEQNARKIFAESSPEFKQTLIDTFGADYFNQKITDRIKTFEDALKEVGDVSGNMIILLAYNGTDKDLIASQAFAKLTIIARALNQGWRPDFSDSNQKKWYPWFKYNGSGFGFSHTVYDCTFTYTYSGSRLCFATEELAEYAGTQFIQIYNDLLN